MALLEISSLAALGTPGVALFKEGSARIADRRIKKLVVALDAGTFGPNLKVTEEDYINVVKAMMLDAEDGKVPYYTEVLGRKSEGTLPDELFLPLLRLFSDLNLHEIEMLCKRGNLVSYPPDGNRTSDELLEFLEFIRQTGLQQPLARTGMFDDERAPGKYFLYVLKLMGMDVTEDFKEVLESWHGEIFV